MATSWAMRARLARASLAELWARLMDLVPERWTVVEVASVGLLCGGVWARYGAPEACMLLGGLGLLLAAVRGLMLARASRQEGS